MSKVKTATWLLVAAIALAGAGGLRWAHEDNRVENQNQIDDITVALGGRAENREANRVPSYVLFALSGFGALSAVILYAGHQPERLVLEAGNDSTSEDGSQQNELQTAERADTQPMGLAAELADLARLRDDGLLTESEFELAKVRLLSE